MRVRLMKENGGSMIKLHLHSSDVCCHTVTKYSSEGSTETSIYFKIL